MADGPHLTPPDNCWLESLAREIRSVIKAVFLSVRSTKAVIMALWDLMTEEGHDLGPLINFLRKQLPQSDLQQRKWNKPAARYDKVWRWILFFNGSNLGRGLQLIVTRKAVMLRN